MSLFLRIKTDQAVIILFCNIFWHLKSLTNTPNQHSHNDGESNISGFKYKCNYSHTSLPSILKKEKKWYKSCNEHNLNLYCKSKSFIMQRAPQGLFIQINNYYSENFEARSVLRLIHPWGKVWVAPSCRHIQGNVKLEIIIWLCGFFLFQY